MKFSSWAVGIALLLSSRPLFSDPWVPYFSTGFSRKFDSQAISISSNLGLYRPIGNNSIAGLALHTAIDRLPHPNRVYTRETIVPLMLGVSMMHFFSPPARSGYFVRGDFGAVQTIKHKVECWIIPNTRRGWGVKTSLGRAWGSSESGTILVQAGMTVRHFVPRNAIYNHFNLMIGGLF